MAIEYRIVPGFERSCHVESRRWDAVRSSNATPWKRLRRLSASASEALQVWLLKRHPHLRRYAVSEDGTVYYDEE